MVEEGEESKTYQYLVLLLGVASLVLATATIYVMEFLAINYGVGAGAVIQSLADGRNVTATIQQTVSQFDSLGNAMKEVYLISLLAFGMLASSLILYMTRYRRFGALSRRYSLLHTALTAIYIALFFIVLSNFNVNYFSPYFLLVYTAMGTALAIDAFLEFEINAKSPIGSKSISGFRIEPETPYTNIVRLREGIFSKLHGDVRIVDKHFNSDAISNLNRLLESNGNIDKMFIISSPEMFDAKFQENYTDFKNEMKNREVEIIFMLMSKEDGIAQHERFIFDEERAYKIPPLNIINKKSEHIVNLKLGEARSRFDELMRNTTKYENYVVKQARGPESQ
jgi:hypothetical protein